MLMVGLSNIPNFSSNAAFTKAYFSNTTTLNAYRLGMAYGGGAAPGLSSLRQGITF
jgi:hypothetical protein